MLRYGDSFYSRFRVTVVVVVVVVVVGDAVAPSV
jgi:hypothetical protein